MNGIQVTYCLAETIDLHLFNKILKKKCLKAMTWTKTSHKLSKVAEQRKQVTETKEFVMHSQNLLSLWIWIST